MPLDTKINFIVTSFDYPVGKIHKMYTWVEGFHTKPEAQEYLNSIEDKIKNELKETIPYIRSIKMMVVICTNKSENVEYGDLVLDKSIDVKSGDTKTIEKKVEVFNVNKVDYSLLTDIEMDKIEKNISIERIKRKYELSDGEYEFYSNNKEFIDISDVKNFCQENGYDDLYILQKRNARKLITDKLGVGFLSDIPKRKVKTSLPMLITNDNKPYDIYFNDILNNIKIYQTKDKTKNYYKTDNKICFIYDNDGSNVLWISANILNYMYQNKPDNLFNSTDDMDDFIIKEIQKHFPLLIHDVKILDTSNYRVCEIKIYDLIEAEKEGQR